MASFSVTNNLYLRQVYAPNRNLSVGSNRTTASSKTLINADSTALGNAVGIMGKIDFSNDSDTGKDKFFKTLKSFTDAYNYTISSTSGTKSKKMASLSSGLKSLTEKYEKELKSLGISVKNGYLSLSSNASSNVSPDNYKELFGKDSTYMKELAAYAKKLGKSVDVAL